MNVNGNALLNNILTGDNQTLDAAVLRFNFVCEGNKVQFRYVFASEEYPEYVCSDFNDVFGFFISGPGITGTQNLAVLPGSNALVSINSVNGGSVGSEGSSGNPCILSNSNLYRPNSSSSVEYDGWTSILTAMSNVIPCQTYTLTIAIADVKDRLYDSAVFLESKSFTSTEITLSSESSYVGGLSDIYESCGYNTIKVFRSGNLSSPLTINLTPGGTATYGVDYTAFPTSITFPAGVDMVSFEVFALADGISETVGETIEIIYTQTGCFGTTIKQVNLKVYDPPPTFLVDAGLDQSYTCPNVEVTLSAIASGGVQPYSYQWQNFPALQNPVTTIPGVTTTYSVIATDQCGSTATDDVLVDIVGYIPLSVSAHNDTSICKGSTIQIWGDYTGGKSPLVYSWEDSSITSLIRSVSPEQTISYTFTVTDACTISQSETINVDVNEVKALYSLSYIDHSTIQFIDLSYLNILTWDWDFGDGLGNSIEQNPTYIFPDTGSFIVNLEVKDAFGCIDKVSNPVKSYPPFHFYIPNTFTPDGDGLNDNFSGIGEGFVSYEMYIFNRWGEQIFHSDNYNTPWGKGARGALDRVQNDVYAYKIILTKPTLERVEFIGRITAIR
jgi:gliding motility-associated-like protein